ncbi:MAG: hypothetical protein IKS01_01480 [Paludibacteraceae bacterium]|nr:hypothetical protein [Paludibacteraceae bacterium]
MKDILNKIGDYIESLEQRIAVLETRTEKVARLEARIEELEAKIAELNERPEVDPAPVSEPEHPVENVPEPVVESEEEPAPVAEPELVAEPEHGAIPAPVVEPVVEPAPEPAAPHIPVQTSLFGAPVQDIRKAISLGDRFLFQRELFGGSAERMQKTLDALNALGSFAEAEQYVHANFQWDRKSASYELFIAVLKRRFA